MFFCKPNPKVPNAALLGEKYNYLYRECLDIINPQYTGLSNGMTCDAFNCRDIFHLPEDKKQSGPPISLSFIYFFFPTPFLNARHTYFS